MKETGGKPDRNSYPLPYSLRNPYRNLKSQNSQDYAQKLQCNCTFMNSASGKRPSLLCRSEADGREWALAPPDYLPPNFFNPDGSRVWAKLASGIHQCELCGYEAKTKNKYREKQVQNYSIEKDDNHIKLCLSVFFAFGSFFEEWYFAVRTVTFFLVFQPTGRNCFETV
jgi:hypothetical protein